MSRKLPLAFYRRTDVVVIARDLLGKALCAYLPASPAGGEARTRSLPRVLTSGLIVETEAYAGPEDRGRIVTPEEVQASSRVGVAYAGPHARRPWRFRLRDNPWTSPAR